MVNQGNTKTESYIHEINADEHITQNGLIFKNELSFLIGNCNKLLQREIIYAWTMNAIKGTFSYLQKNPLET